MIDSEQLVDLPGAELVLRGLHDLNRGDQTVEALLVASGSSRLREMGLSVSRTIPAEPEHRLYELLSQRHGDDAHSRYNAMMGKLVSFRRALELRIRHSPAADTT